MPALAKKVLRIGVVGYGKMGHLRSEFVRRHPSMELVAVCDLNPAADDMGSVRFVRRYEELLTLDVDAVVVCTTNDWNARITMDALNSGRHVFCEKPPARNTVEMRQIMDVESAHPHLKLKFGFNHRYHDGIIECKALVDSGQMGKILWARGIYGKAGGRGFEKNWRNRGDISGGGVLLDQGIHMVDLLRYFCGDFEEVKSLVATRFWDIDVEDNAFALLRNSTGQVAMLHSSATHWKQQFSLEIYLQQGYAIVNGILSQSLGYGRETLIIARRDDPAKTAPIPREEITYFDQDHSWQREIDEFSQAILSDHPIRIGHSQDAWNTLHLIEQIYHSDASWKRWTSVPTGTRPPAVGEYTEDVAWSEPSGAGRHVMISDELHESQVHPDDLYEQYLALSERDTQQWFKQTALTPVDCPICGRHESSPAYSKWGLSYVECKHCASLFVSPRPTPSQVDDYRRQSSASQFWREQVLAKTSRSHEEKIFLPRRQWIQSLCTKQFKSPVAYMDFAPKFEGFLAACATVPLFKRRLVVSPDAGLSQACLTHGCEVLDPLKPCFSEDVLVDLVSGFEALNEVHNPRAWVQQVHGWLQPEGLLVLTARTISGFDLQVLGVKSRNIHPMDHLNLPSIEGLSKLLEELGFEILELSTPGQLDLEMVERAYRADSTLPLPRFLKDLMERRTDEDRRQFQEFLQRARMSSYLRIAARKK